MRLITSIDYMKKQIYNKENNGNCTSLLEERELHIR